MIWNWIPVQRAAKLVDKAHVRCNYWRENRCVIQYSDGVTSVSVQVHRKFTIYSHIDNIQNLI